MASRKLTEIAVNLIQSEIQSKISSALTDVRTDRADNSVQVPLPQEYFLFAPAKVYRPPAIFVICESMDMRNAQQGANHISGLARILVSCVVEDRTASFVLKAAWRYQAALHKILHETALTSSDNTVKLVIKVDRISFSPEFTNAEDPSMPDGVFRKEMVLELEVEHYENL